MAVSTWTCPHCNQLVEVDVDRTSSHQVICGACDGWMEIPADATFSSAAPPPPPLSAEPPARNSQLELFCASCGVLLDDSPDHGDATPLCQRCEVANAVRAVEQIEPSVTGPPTPPQVESAPQLPKETESTRPPVAEPPPILLSEPPIESPSKPLSASEEPEMVIPLPDGDVKLSEPSAVAALGNTTRPLRRLTREERSRRRMVRNLVFLAIGLTPAHFVCALAQIVSLNSVDFKRAPASRPCWHSPSQILPQVGWLNLSVFAKFSPRP